MSFTDNYTTLAIKTSILDNKEISPAIKELESKKIEVSNEAFLNAEMQEKLINKLEHLRLSNI